MHAQHDEEGFHRNVGVPDDQILREQRVNPEHREREHHQPHVTHDVAFGEDITLAQNASQAYRRKRHRHDRAPESAREEPPAEQRGMPQRRQ